MGRSRLYYANIKCWHIWVFLLTLCHHHRGEVLRVDRGIAKAAHKEWDTANVVEVTVGNKHRANTVLVFLQVARVREDVIDSRVCASWHKLEAGVTYKDVVFCFDGEHVATHFFYATKWHDADGFFVAGSGEVVGLVLGCCCCGRRRRVATQGATNIAAYCAWTTRPLRAGSTSTSSTSTARTRTLGSRGRATCWCTLWKITRSWSRSWCC